MLYYVLFLTGLAVLLGMNARQHLRKKRRDSIDACKFLLHPDVISHLTVPVKTVAQRDKLKLRPGNTVWVEETDRVYQLNKGDFFTVFMASSPAYIVRNKEELAGIHTPGARVWVRQEQNYYTLKNDKWN